MSWHCDLVCRNNRYAPYKLIYAVKLVMINRNLGKFERAIRLVLGVLVLTWVFSQEALGIGAWIAMICGVFLVLNGLFSRCYLWHVLGIDTTDEDGLCREESTPQ